MVRNCYSCKKEIIRSKSLFKKLAFCNHNCYSKYKSKQFTGTKNPRYNGGDKKTTCTNCKVKFTRQNINKERNFCSRDCYYKFRSEYYIKERHPLFRGVVTRTTRQIRSTKKYYIWQQSILQKNNYSCQTCSSKENLHVHHIVRLYDLYKDYEELFGKVDCTDDFFYKKDNGITLCKKCHIKIHKNCSK